MSNILSLLDEVEYVLVSKSPLIEFESTSNEQIIMSPAFQLRILDALLGLFEKYHSDVKEIFEDNSELISFTTMFVNLYRLKQVDKASND